MKKDAEQTAVLASEGDSFELLESGEQYFPAVLAAIAEAQHEILIETFILFEDEVGGNLQRALIAAGRRGVKIDITIDGYGSPDLSESFIQSLLEVGARVHVYDPQRPLLGLRTNIFRRMHRKLVAIDGKMAFVGGINYSVDQLAEKRPNGKLDFAVRVTGSLVPAVQQFMRKQVECFYARRRIRWPRFLTQRLPPATDLAEFVVRDNQEHRDDIERHYRRAIHSARHEITICNAYFFPGYRLLTSLRRAARRGVRVTLILQGAPDMPRVKSWEKLLYAPLLEAGVRIYEYVQHPVHAKVAVIDQQWSTVGSSNLDPLSLTLNLEANVIIKDAAFCAGLYARLQQIKQSDCTAVSAEHLPRHNGVRIMVQTAAYHVTRYFPKLAGWLPAHIPKLHSLDSDRIGNIGARVADGSAS